MASCSRSCQGNHNTLKQWTEQCLLTSIDKRQRKISFNGVCGSPMTAGLPYTHPSCVTVEGAFPHSAERRYNSGVGQGPYDTVTSGRDKRASMKTKQGKIFPHEMISATETMWALYVLIRSKAHSYAEEQRHETTCKGLTFPTCSMLKFSQISMPFQLSLYFMFTIILAELFSKITSV